MKKSTPIIAAISVILAIILYLLAERYLIQHVEITDVNAYAQSATVEINEPEDTRTIMPVAATAEPAETATPAIISDDWHYQNEGLSITISEVSAGSGSDTVTYFVADVILSDATQLKSAFAQNQFGANIIEYTSEIAQANDAIFAINGDYYGFRTDGIEIRNGVIYRDEPARIGLAFYTDGSMGIYDETQTSAQQLLDDGVWNTLSFGPTLVQDSVAVTNFQRVSIDRNFGNHSIQGNNPRTGIGMIDNNHFVFVAVDGRSPGYSRGVSLAEFAQIFSGLGCTEAYNIDGGGSTTMYFMGRVVNNPLGEHKERGTSDIIYIGL